MRWKLSLAILFSPSYPPLPLLLPGSAQERAKLAYFVESTRFTTANMSDAQANEAEKNVSFLSFFFLYHLESGRKCAWPWNPAFAWTRVIFILSPPDLMPRAGGLERN